MTQRSSREHLIRTASALFRRKGYAGVGLTEILTAACLPKGSLYHHFPGGKQQLAEAATRWAGARVERMIDAAFAGADGFGAGALAICRLLAQELSGEAEVPACPVLSILQAGPEEPALRRTAAEIYGDWTACIARHAARFGVAAPDRAAASLHARMQGAWVLAYASQSAAPFEALAEELAAELAVDPTTDPATDRAVAPGREAPGG